MLDEFNGDGVGMGGSVNYCQGEENTENIGENMGVDQASVPAPSKRGGARKGAGRKKGSLNTKNLMSQMFHRMGTSYEDELGKALMHPDISPDKRLDALVKLAQYQFDKPIQEVKQTTNDRKTLTIKVVTNTQSQLSADRKKELEAYLGIGPVIEGECVPVDDKGGE